VGAQGPKERPRLAFAPGDKVAGNDDAMVSIALDGPAKATLRYSGKSDSCNAIATQDCGAGVIKNVRNYIEPIPDVRPNDPRYGLALFIWAASAKRKDYPFRKCGGAAYVGARGLAWPERSHPGQMNVRLNRCWVPIVRSQVRADSPAGVPRSMLNRLASQRLLARGGTFTKTMTWVAGKPDEWGSTSQVDDECRLEITFRPT
jgi:hypothetical protein